MPNKPPGSRPANSSVAQRSATARAQKKMRFFNAPPASAFSSTRAYIFSYSLGTDSTRVGFTSCMSIGTVSIDSAYAIDVPVAIMR